VSSPNILQVLIRESGRSLINIGDSYLTGWDVAHNKDAKHFKKKSTTTTTT
jgi:hypothetical protein